MTGEQEKIVCRIVVFVGPKGACVEESEKGTLLLSGLRGRIGVSRAVLEKAVAAKLVSWTRNDLNLTQAGAALRAKLVRVQNSQREVECASVETGAGWETVAINLAESPLGQLAKRRDRNGRSYLEQAEFEAGERLRADFTRAQLSPRMGMNWSGTPITNRGGGHAGGMADLSDAAMAARQRVQKAIEATGPELSGVLLDVCCFLKGLEQVEAERGWPVRSAKVMLKAALGALGRHYSPPRQASRTKQTLHWGAEDYRPTIR